MNLDIILSYHKYDNKPRLKIHEHLPERHRQTWTDLEDFALTERYLTLKDYHAIAVLHKRTFRSIYCRLVYLNLIKNTLTKDEIQKQNKIYIRQRK